MFDKTRNIMTQEIPMIEKRIDNFYIDVKILITHEIHHVSFVHHTPHKKFFGIFEVTLL